MAYELITIASYQEPMEAHIDIALLEAEGIQCFLSGEHFTGMHWLASLATGGAKLRVKETDAARAIEILSARKQARPEEQAQADEDDEQAAVRCPRCGSDIVERHRFSRVMFFLSMLLFGCPLPWPAWDYRCCDCGHRWELQDDSAKEK